MRSIEASLLMRRRRQRESRSKRTLSSRLRTLLWIAGSLLTLGTALAGLTAGLVYRDLRRNLPSVDLLPELFDPASSLYQPTRVYDRTGEHLLLTLSTPGVERRYLALDPAQAEHISEELARLTVAAEDPGFYRHTGATWDSLVGMTAPTIAERLATEYMLAGEEAGIRKRLRIAILAMEATERFGRDQVLEWYLNTVSYGHLAYGAEAGAQTYFGKSAASLDLAEAALLVSTARNPEVDPLEMPAEAFERAKNLLGRLLVDRLITSQDYLQARGESLQLRDPVEEVPSAAPALTGLALNQLTGLLGTERLERGGLTIRTTLDFDLQRPAECLLRLGLTQGGPTPGETDGPEDGPCPAADLLPEDRVDAGHWPDGLIGSALVLDPQTGQILAMVGEVTGEGAQRELAAHPAGTLLSPFIYLGGFTKGLSPAAMVWDVPPSDAGPADIMPDTPTDQAVPYHGPERLRLALVNDHLAPAQQILEQVGPETVVDLFSRFGLTGVNLRDLEGQRAGFPLSESRITLLEAARSYAVFAGEGVLRGQSFRSDQGAIEPAAVLQVIGPSGEVIFDGSQARMQSIVSPPLAYMVNSVLSDETARLTGEDQAGLLETGHLVSVRYGNSGDHESAWTIEYTPQRLVGVWVGVPDSLPVPTPFDASASAAIGSGLIRYAVQNLPAEEWDVPPGIAHVEVCDPSGLLPKADCPNVVSEVFLTGSEPVIEDTLFQRLEVNRETGLLATVFTPPEQIEERVIMQVPPEHSAWAASVGLSMPPEEYDPIRLPPPLADVHFSTPAAFDAVRGKVRLTGTAAGKDFAYYRILVGKGMNPDRWEQVGEDVPQAVTEGVLAEWDTAGLEGVYAVRLLVVDGEDRYQTATILLTIDNTPPSVRIVAPQDGDSIEPESGRPVVFRVDGFNPVEAQRMEWYLDGKVISTQVQAPFALSWAPVVGKHTLEVKVYDFAGNVGEAEVEFRVD